jgi:hypothetical protein
MKSKITALLLLATLGLAACEALGDARDPRIDPGAPYRPTPDPVQPR